MRHYKTRYEIEGVTRGVLRGKRDFLLLGLEIRFKEVPATVREQILKISDVKRIEQLFDALIDAKNLDEFLKELNSLPAVVHH